jgi:hypothetical protein
MYRICQTLIVSLGLCLGLLAQQQSPLSVSLVQLIATPEKYDGKMVTVRGFLAMDREGDLLYLSQADADNVLLSNATWIRRTEAMGREKELLNRKYVKVVGTFRQDFKEHLGNPSGGIPEVRTVELWSDPAHPMSQKVREIPGVSKQ